jgi:hypothetical protein
MTYVARSRDLLNQLLPPVDPDLRRLYLLLVHVKGEAVTWRDVHDAWSIWKADVDPGHPSIVPFEELDRHIQELDKPYADAIEATAARLADDRAARETPDTPHVHNYAQRLAPWPSGPGGETSSLKICGCGAQITEEDQ